MPVEVLFVGDLMLSAPEPARFFAPSREILTGADIAVGHLEWPHTERGQVCVVDIPAPACPPAHLDAVADAGFEVLTLASNHMFDQGPFGVADTVAAVRARGMRPVGAGATIEEARRPAVVERDGITFGFLSYNAVGPRESWATPVKAGVAPVRVINHYELDVASPGSAPAEYTSVEPESEEAMRADIAALAADVDVVCVSLHKGMGFVHATLACYERPLARAAVEAGADVVIGHHAHILRGVEVYRGRPIFHGINHFVPAYTAETDPLGGKRPRPSRAPSIGFFTPDPGRAPFPFPRDSRHTMIARVVVDAGGIVEAGFIPCHLDTDAVPVPGSDATVDYVERITRDAGLAAGFTRRGRHVTFLDRATTGERAWA
ncbi:MAG TPA: CapA family protein [Pseudonocardia sp.]|jgi:poly-gamma-glutamate synthesis protein (capsule biosynthesis protein)|uniref:CapA family protein n=1 Tax=Pseudonocardia sp. TaxID=60912 RepID=UPI002B4B0553|nr:CapA family protein [Pseudonocardia sp.]HLU54806.1 CapA family protein [Pseudonocardia sp.]